MEGDQVYMDEFAAECWALYGDGHSVESLSSNHTAIWPLSAQGNCRYKLFTDTESRDNKKRLQTQYFTTNYVESMRTPMSELLKQSSNLQPMKVNQPCKDACIERVISWVDSNIKKKNIPLISDKST